MTRCAICFSVLVSLLQHSFASEKETEFQIHVPADEATVSEIEIVVRGQLPQPDKGKVAIYVRPLTGNEPWYFQTLADVDAKTGLFVGFATLGDTKTPTGVEFQMRAFQVDSGFDKKKDGRRLPTSSAKSNTVYVTKGAKNKFPETPLSPGSIDIEPRMVQNRVVRLRGKVNVKGGWPVLVVRPLADPDTPSVHSWFVQQHIDDFDEDSGEFTAIATLGAKNKGRKFAVLTFLVKSATAARSLADSQIDLGQLPTTAISNPLVVTVDE